MINQVALRYASAMYEVAAKDQKQDQYLAELRAIAEVFEKNTEIAAFFKSPTVSIENKAAALKAAFSGKASQDVFNLLMLLNEKNRMDVFCDIAHSFETMIDDARGVSRGTVRSASTLDAEQRKKLEDSVKKVTGRQVILKFEVDPTLVGGMVAKVGGWTFDDSLSSHLQTMKDHLSRRTTVGH